jgi:hypothetical protein
MREIILDYIIRKIYLRSLVILQASFIILKVVGVFNADWIVVFLPLILSAIPIILMAIVMLVVITFDLD